MDNVTIEYQFTFTNHEFLKIPLILNPESMELNIDITSNNDHSKWAKLDFNKCKHCPLNNDSHPDCPLASKLLPVVELFAHIISTDTVDLKVITPFRTISENTQAQSAISSLIGIIMATSGCPYTAFFKPMARFHLPLAEIEETVFRATSMYMLAQYYRHKRAKPPALIWMAWLKYMKTCNWSIKAWRNE